MPDTVHDDRLAEAFTRFRSQVREEIRPPGTHAVRRSVRRRRTVRAAGAAAAVVLFGAVAAIVTTVDNPDMTSGAYPTLSAAELEELAVQAGNAFREEPVVVGFPPP
ncbi:MAG TPA: hypothetical protein VFM54_07720 [Micromonosporaceae bacterium]|nr:hypothetical protein [Micromonosporaceae bacterium]